MESAFVKFAISVFVLFLQTKPGLENKGEKVNESAFAKIAICVFLLLFYRQNQG